MPPKKKASRKSKKKPSTPVRKIVNPPPLAVIYEERQRLATDLKERRDKLRRGTVSAVDHDGHVIKQDSSISINATKGAVGELTRIIEKLEVPLADD